MVRELSVVAYSFESRFPLRKLAAWFPDDAVLHKAQKTHVVVDGLATGQAFAFDFGALVFIDVPEDKRDEVLGRFSVQLPREPHPPLREDFLIEVTEGVPVTLLFDRIRLSELTLEASEVIATVVAQSVTLDYYDQDVQAMLDRIGRISTGVAKRGKIGGRTKDLVRFIGASVASQVEIISALALLDEPALTWENELLDRMHAKLRKHFEIAERHAAIDVKLATVRGAMEVFLDMTQTRRTLILEVTIVLLILVEIVLSLLKLT